MAEYPVFPVQIRANGAADVSSRTLVNSLPVAALRSLYTIGHVRDMIGLQLTCSVILLPTTDVLHEQMQMYRIQYVRMVFAICSITLHPTVQGLRSERC